MALYIEPAGRLGGAGTYKQLPRCSGIRRRATAKQIAGFALNLLCLLVSTPLGVATRRVTSDNTNTIQSLGWAVPLYMRLLR